MGRADCIVHPVDDTLRAQGALDGTMPPIAYQVLKISKPLILTKDSQKTALYGCTIQYTGPFCVKGEGMMEPITYYMDKCQFQGVGKIGK